MNLDFLKEENGQVSSTRVLFFIGMVWAMTTSTVMACMMSWTAGEFIAVFTATSGVFVGLKLGQKPMESKIKPKENDEPK